LLYYKNYDFEWDDNKNISNQKKHHLSFEKAQYVFLDEDRIIAQDLEHSQDKKRYFCFGKVDSEIITVRFVYRDDKIRIFGAGYWRKGKKIYEQKS